MSPAKNERKKKKKRERNITPFDSALPDIFGTAGKQRTRRTQALRYTLHAQNEVLSLDGGGFDNQKVSLRPPMNGEAFCAFQTFLSVFFFLFFSTVLFMHPERGSLPHPRLLFFFCEKEKKRK